MSNRECLCECLLNILDGLYDDEGSSGIQPKMRYQGEFDEAVRCAVCDLTKMTPEEWRGLLPEDQVPWLQKAIAEAERQQGLAECIPAEHSDLAAKIEAIRRRRDDDTQWFAGIQAAAGRQEQKANDEQKAATLMTESTAADHALFNHAHNPNPSRSPVDVNVIQLSGEIWHVQYQEGGEAGDFKNQKGSVFHHLVRLLAEPNRRFKASEFFRPAGACTDPILKHGRDESSDDVARAAYAKDMQRLAKEIKEATDAHDLETAGRLREEFHDLAKHLKGEEGAGNHGRKKRCGALSPAEKADQNLRMLISKLRTRLQTNGLPKLAEHFRRCINNAECEWFYVPLPNTSPWQIITPSQAVNKRNI